jgi:hypothetical protein
MRDDLFCPTGDFGVLWAQCDVGSNFPRELHRETFFSFGGLGIRVASSLADLQYIQDFARSHSFGYRTAFLTLIAEDSNGPVGALLAQPCLSVRFPHSAATRVFGAAYEYFRQDSLSISRIFTSDKANYRLEVQEALLLGFIEVAPFLVEGSLRIVEAASYDPHPLTHKLGFHAELPDRPTDSIYYWKPFDIPKGFVHKRATNEEDTRRAMHALVAARANMKFYGAFARLQDLGQVVRQREWGLENYTSNRGLWTSLRPRDTIFFIRDRQILEGYGVVEEIKYERDYPRYPLRILFKIMEVPYISADLTVEPFSEWLQLPSRGSLFHLNNMAGSQLRTAVDLRQSEGKMWIIPNQYLLPGTDFVQIQRQIFVVQAWALKDNVLPTLREILVGGGYTVTHAEDRQGQVIFGDIWKLMNEAEVVLVDFTEKRPNVYLEYGMAIVLGKPIVALSQRHEDVPSDTPQLKVIDYENSMAGTKVLAPRLLKAVEERITGLRSRTALAP